MRTDCLLRSPPSIDRKPLEAGEKKAFVTIADPPNKLAFVDAHAHLYDSRVVPYGIFSRRDAVFEALVGDYAALPRTFLLGDYLRATSSRQVEGVVWHEIHLR